MTQLAPRGTVARDLLRTAVARREELGGGLIVIGAACVGASALSMGLGGDGVAPGMVLASLACAVGTSLRRSAADERESAAGPPPGHPERDD